MTGFKRAAGWIVGLIGGILLLILFLAGMYASRSFAQLDGKLTAPGLHEAVRIERDAADVTHIRAGSGHDAWFALGYVHAQERGWQLEFNRRVMHGELSEIFGEATLETDKLIRTLGIMQAAKAQYAGLNEQTKQALQEYAEGINAFNGSTSQAISPEFLILRTRPGRWEAVDSVGWLLMMALDLGGNWGSEFARLSASKTLSNKELWQLFPPYPGEQPASRRDLPQFYRDLGIYREAVAQAESGSVSENRLALWSRDFNDELGGVQGKGSNNWVVAGSHTSTGKPLLANDPHLGLGAPAIWYFAHLDSPDMNAIGATLPGLPFVVLGRTDKVAWGFTNTGPDVQDLYLEYINPEDKTLYRVPDIKGSTAWESFKTRNEHILVKGKPAVDIVVRSTRHGPVLSDAQQSHAELLDTSRYVISLRWSALDADNHTAEAALLSNKAQSVDDLRKGFALYHSPMQNVVMADVSGKIYYQAMGKTPIRKAENDIMGMAPSPGWDARYDWAGWIPADQNPQDAGAKGWIATANARITPPNYKYFMGQDWSPPYRTDRINELLAAKPQHDMQSMGEIQGDIKSLATVRLLPFLQKTRSSHALAEAAQKQLASFDGVMRADAASPLIFAAWVDELTRALIAPKLGETKFTAMYGKRNFRAAVEEILERDDGNWCGSKGCAAQSAEALDKALDRLQKLYGSNVADWQWGKAHMALSVHNPFDKVAALAPYFDVSVPTGGDAYTVNAGQYWVNDPRPFANRHAASMRALYDLADLENSRFIYQTGQSGLVFSGRYRDMKDEWAQVKYRALQMHPKSMTHTLELLP